MRWHLKRAKLLFALIPIISIAFYILTANHNIFADQSFSAFDIYQQICDTAQPVTGKDAPADYTAAENFAIAANVYLQADAVASETNGTVTAMGFYKQTVLNKHIRYNGHIFSESVSLSAIASVAEQRYFKDGALLFRKGSASGSSVKSWDNSVTELTTATYRQRYGVVPQEITKYAVQAKNIEEGRLVSENADGTYTYELVLDPEGAQEFARYEMMTFAGVTSFPDFISCRLVFTIDKTWHIRTIEAYDTYKIDLMGGIKCDSRLVETYTFDNVTMPDSAQIFIDYVPTGNTGDIGSEKGPADYLNTAFGDYISGKRALNLAANFEIAGNTLPLAACIDIAGGDYRFMLGDEIFAAYTDNALYIGLGDNKYMLNVADVTALMGGGLPFDLNADQLLSLLFENYTLTETDTHIYIRLPFTLFGIDLDVNMGLKKTDGGSVTADTIDATLGLGGISATADIDIIDSVTLPALHKEEYASLQPVLQSIANTLKSKTFYLRTEGALSATDAAGVTRSEPFTAGVTLRLPQDDQPFALACALKVSGQTLNVVWQNGTVYCNAGALAFRLQADKAQELLASVQPLLGDAGTFLQNVSYLIGEESAQVAIKALNAVQKMLSFTGADLPKPDINALVSATDVRKLLSVITSLRVENGVVSLPVGDGNVSLTTDGQFVTGFAAHNISVGNVALDMSATVTPDATFAIAPDENDYFDLSNLAQFAPVLGKLLASPAVRLEISDGMLNTSMLSGSIKGSVELQLSPSLRVQADLMWHDHTVRALYDNATETYCVQINEIKVTFTEDEIRSLAAQLRTLIRRAGGDEQTATAIAALANDAVQTVTLIQNALGGKTLQELFSSVTHFAPSGNGFTLGMGTGDFSLTATVTATDEVLDVDITNINGGADIYDSYAHLTLRPVNGLSAVDLSESDCVRIADLQSYILPAVNFTREQYYTVTFGGTVTAYDGNTTAITGVADNDDENNYGVLQLQRTQGFINAYVGFTLTDKSGKHTIKLYLIDGTEYNDANTVLNKNALLAYVDYNSFYAQIDYASVLGILGSLGDILNIKLPAQVEEMLKEAGYVHYQTDVFQTMDIAGLDGLRDTLSSLLGTGEDVADITESGSAGMMGMLSDDMLHSILHGISLRISDGLLHIGIDNGIFSAVNSGVKATVTIGHDGENLSYVDIADLKANGDTVNFTANFSFTAFADISAPDGAMDFSSVDGLLYTLIQTADLREFEIDSEIKLEIPVLSDPVIPANIKVKILDDGSTVAAVKLEVPFVSAVVSVGLTRTDSYIYFVDNMLYFVVDVWDSWIWGAGSYKKTEYMSATVDEFLANPTDYLFFLLRMGDMIKNPVISAINKGGDETPSKNPSDILKEYSYRNNTYSLTVDLRKLAGNSDMGDLHFSLGATEDGYVRSLAFDTAFAGIATVRLQNTKLTNLNVDANNRTYFDENGKRTKALTPIGFGKNAAFANLGLRGDIDALGESLAKIFPVEAAETAAQKADDNAEKAMTAAKKAVDAQKTVTSAQADLQEAQADHDAAVQKLAGIPADSFGYERAQAMVDYTALVLRHAQEDLLSAQTAQLHAANAALTAAQGAYTAAQDAAQKANAALNRNTSLDHAGISDVRAYAAAGDAAIAVVNAINACESALDAAKQAATAAEERGEALLEEIQTYEKYVSDTKKETATNVTTAANRACLRAIDAAETAKAQTATAHAEAKADNTKWITAADNAGKTLSAVDAMQTTGTAALQAAQMSENADLLTEAQQNADAVATTAQSAATVAANAAIDAANNIAALGKTAADTASEHAQAENDTEAYAQLGGALAYAQASFTAAKSAQAAALLCTDGDLQEQAQTAANAATDAAAYIGKTGLSAAADVSSHLAAKLQAAQADDLASMQAAAQNTVLAAGVSEYAIQCYRYAPSDERLQKLYGAFANAVSAATDAVERFGAFAYDAAQNNQTATEKAYKTAIDECNYNKIGSGTRTSEVKNAANGIQTQAEEIATISQAVYDILHSTHTIFTIASNSPAMDSAYTQRAQVALGGETSGWVGASIVLKASASKTADAAPKLTTRADGLTNIFGSANAAIAAAAAANTAADAATGNSANAYNAANTLAQLLSRAIAVDAES